MEPGERGREAEGGPSREVEAGKEKPRRVIHFASGETMVESSSEEELEEEQPVQRVDPSTLPWRHFLWFWVTHFARRSLFTCDFLGEKLADLFGLTTAKYQYAVDEYFTVQDQKDEDGEEVTEMEEIEVNERKHLPLQTSEYGTLNTAESPGINSRAEYKHQVSYTNEVLEDN
ncbi:protein FAM177B-like [Pristis pectinata]|uniref:protein FAM177B-like n=1 Tax=Pristis pectinata TaxID=685728 RepID=UPI00223E60CA|nr:protein FAM177B-like [Pristis pectinata]